MLLMKLKHRILDGIILSNADDQGWQQIAVEGEWKGHWMGPFSLDEIKFDKIIAQSKLKNIDIVVDYEHNSYTSISAPAAGWVKKNDFEKRIIDGLSTLWAKINWTNKATKHIENDEYRYLSPTIKWETTDRVTGEVSGPSIHSIALTNIPFLEELPEIRLNSLKAAFLNIQPTEIDPMDKEQFELLCKALGLKEDSDSKAVMLKIASMATSVETTLKSLEIEKASDIESKIALLKVSSTEVNKGELAELRAKISTLEAQRQAETIETVLFDAQALGKVAGKETDNYKAAHSFATVDLGAFKKYMETVPEGSVVPMSVVTPSATKPTGKPDALLKANMNQFGLTDEDFTKYAKALEVA